MLLDEERLLIEDGDMIPLRLIVKDGSYRGCFGVMDNKDEVANVEFYTDNDSFIKYFVKYDKAITIEGGEIQEAAMYGTFNQDIHLNLKRITEEEVIEAKLGYIAGNILEYAELDGIKIYVERL